MSHFYNEGYIKCFSLVILLLLSDNSYLLYYFEMLNNTYRLCDQWIILPLISIYSYYNYNYFSIAFFKISYLLYWKSDIINYPFMYNFLKVFKNNSRQILLENIKKKILKTKWIKTEINYVVVQLFGGCVVNASSYYSLFLIYLFGYKLNK